MKTAVNNSSRLGLRSGKRRVAKSNLRGNRANQLLLVNYKIMPNKSKGSGCQFMIYKSENKDMYPKAKNYMTINQNYKLKSYHSKVIPSCCSFKVLTKTL